jgi:hypothetical protein
MLSPIDEEGDNCEEESPRLKSTDALDSHDSVFNAAQFGSSSGQRRKMTYRFESRSPTNSLQCSTTSRSMDSATGSAMSMDSTSDIRLFRGLVRSNGFNKRKDELLDELGEELIIAAREGDCEEVRRLVVSGTGPDYSDADVRITCHSGATVLPLQSSFDF